jgi:hypothetical protein
MRKNRKIIIKAEFLVFLQIVAGVSLGTIYKTFGFDGHASFAHPSMSIKVNSFFYF